MRTKITGMAHSEFAKVADSLCVGNIATVIHEPKWDKPEGKAYRVECKGFHIGYVPLVQTIRGYYHDAPEEARQRIAEWGRATVEIRDWLDSRQKYEFEDRWDVRMRRRPMKRVVTPLAVMGARIWGRDGGERAPLAIQGGSLKPITYASPVASAQVKSAILLAGLSVDGETSVTEPHLSRDHSERMLTCFGADVRPFAGGVSLRGRPRLMAQEVIVPGDVSSAAFFMVAGLVTPGAELLIRNVGINPTRSGIIDILTAMGGQLELLNIREQSGEPVADVLVRYSRLKGIEVGGDMIPRAIDEFPVISVAAALAEGTTTIRDAEELRVKETDRIAAMVSELGKLGAQVEARPDGMLITGVEQLSGGKVSSHGDHRIAMSMAVAALSARGEVTIEDTACTETSFPGFWSLIDKLCCA